MYTKATGPYNNTWLESKPNLLLPFRPPVVLHVVCILTITQSLYNNHY